MNVDKWTEFELVKNRYEKENLSEVFATMIDRYHAVDRPEVIDRVNLYELLQSIRTNHKVLFKPELMFNQKVINGKRNPDYDKTKLTLPVVCYNASYRKRKDDRHLESVTNLMYLDVDGFESRKEAEEYRDTIAKRYEWIVACSLSLSKQGVHILIWGDLIRSNEDFNRKYAFINREYFEGRLDSQSLSLTRNTILPADYNMFVNDNPSQLMIDDLISSIDVGKVGSKVGKGGIMKTACTFSFPNVGNKNAHATSYHIPIQLAEELDESEYEDPNKPIYYHGGIDTVRINLFPLQRKRVLEGKRTKTIGALSAKLIYLNRDLINHYSRSKVEQALLNYLLKVNQGICSPPLPDDEVQNSFQANWKRFLAGKLDITMLTEKQRAFWSRESTLAGNEKRKISCTLRNEPVVAESRRKISDAIDEIRQTAEKITQKKVAEVAGMSVQTVKKYWSEYKTQVRELNQQRKKSFNDYSG